MLNKRYGYYLAAYGSRHGDEDFSLEAETIFNAFGFEPNKHGNYQGGKFDGISIYQNEDGSIVKRLSLTDFFSFNHKVIVKDVS